MTSLTSPHPPHAVPSVYPRNVSVQLNESMMVIKWKPPQADKINGILRGYDVVVRHGSDVEKVKLFKIYFT